MFELDASLYIFKITCIFLALSVWGTKQPYCYILLYKFKATHQNFMKFGGFF